MAGLSLMALGPYQFQALGFGFASRSRSTKTPWAQVAVAGGMDRSQWMGGESVTETISGAIFAELGGEAALDGLRVAAEIGTPLPFVDLSGSLFNVFGTWVIEEISEDMDRFDRSGAPLKNAYSIKIRRYEGSLLSSPLTSIVSLFA